MRCEAGGGAVGVEDDSWRPDRTARVEAEALDDVQKRVKREAGSRGRDVKDGWRRAGAGCLSVLVI